MSMWGFGLLLLDSTVPLMTPWLGMGIVGLGGGVFGCGCPIYLSAVQRMVASTLAFKKSAPTLALAAEEMTLRNILAPLRMGPLT
jgi:hypothetical protein